jgi:hypothetical protein
MGTDGFGIGWFGDDGSHIAAHATAFFIAERFAYGTREGRITLPAAKKAEAAEG